MAELKAGGAEDAAESWIAATADRATIELIDVLKRYPPAPSGNGRLAQITSELDALLRRRFSDQNR